MYLSKRSNVFLWFAECICPTWRDTRIGKIKLGMFVGYGSGWQDGARNRLGAASKGRVHAELDITRVARLHKLTPDQENILYYTLSYDISSHITIHISLYIIMLLICTSSQTILLTIGPLDHVLFPASIFFQFFDMLQIDYWQTCCNYIVTNMFQIDCWNLLQIEWSK